MNNNNIIKIILAILSILFLENNLYAQNRDISVIINSPYTVNLAGKVAGISPQRHTLVQFRNHLPYDLTFLLENTKNGKIIAAFTVPGKGAYDIRKVITSKNYKNILIKCSFDQAAFQKYNSQLDKETEDLIEFRKSLFSFFWIIKQLYNDPKNDAVISSLLYFSGIINTEHFANEIKDVLSNNVGPFDQKALTGVFLNVLGKYSLTEEQKDALQLFQHALSALTFSSIANEFAKIENSRRKAAAEYNNADFVENHTYEFRKIAKKTYLLKELIPRLSLNIFNSSSIEADERNLYKSNYKLFTAFRIEKSLFKLIEGKKNLIGLGLYGDFLRNNTTISTSTFDFKHSGYGGGLSLSFYLDWWAMLSLEGGTFVSNAELDFVDTSIDPIKLDTDNPQIQLGLTFHIIPPVLPIGFDMGASLISNQYSISTQSGLSPQQIEDIENILPKHFYLTRLGFTYHFR